MTPHHDDDEHVHTARIVRPYALTAGRTRASIDLPVEAIIEQQPRATEREWSEHDQVGQIVSACAGRTSVAEISAAVHLPLGVVRVLLGDLVEQGYLKVAATTLTDTSSTDVRQDLIERTLRGLRAI
ncbi:hypothetical protein N798_06470 [Knoellia flava TL1]|uniref:DUF742 domain-containing protein n=2 Tax=Knoellia flava TaxID=913969 RepID=A0A8H9FSR6_9MICO|nr:DUF742 domain-containing protein [Knoellia flava]KGN33033.1 hypothetical protein N798_06470 [Knoellia flava TL1]GGB70616.1 hypothetical protein GCM10011314_07450 [Knoellia flava]